MSRAIGELLYPLSDPGRKVCVDVDSTVELMVDSLVDRLVSKGVMTLGVEETSDECEIEGGESISPVTVILVVGEIGAEVLNSKAL